MVEPGAVGDAQLQLREVLHIADPASFHTSMNALEQALEARLPGSYGEDSDPGELTLRIVAFSAARLAAYRSTSFARLSSRSIIDFLATSKVSL